jgi:hypothetical protein
VRVFRPPLCACIYGVVRAPRGPGAASDLDGPRGAGRGPGLSWDAFISVSLRELGVALCRGKASLGRSGL